MHPHALTLAARWARLLRSAPDMTGDDRRREAGGLGADCLAAGLGVQDVAAMHRRALGALLDDDPDPSRDIVDVGAELLVDALVPFDAEHRGRTAARTAQSRHGEPLTDIAEVVAHADDAVFAADLDGRITSVNVAGEILTGYPTATLRALTLVDLLGPANAGITDRLRALRRLRRVRRGHLRHSRFDVDVIDRYGRSLPLAVHVRTVVEHGRAVGIQGIARDVAAQRQAHAGLRSLHERLEQKVQAIARALHDEAGQLLVSVYLQLDALGAELPENADVQGHVARLRARLDQVTEELRRLAHELRPTVLDDLGLDSACQFLADGVARRAQLAVAVHGSVGGRLAPEVETAVYRVVQEAVTNAVRHARPRAISIDFDRRADAVRGRVRDDGTGFDVSQVLSRTGRYGLGLMGMRERVVSVGGALTIRSSPGMGTSVTFDVPVECRDVSLSTAGR